MLVAVALSLVAASCGGGDSLVPPETSRSESTATQAPAGTSAATIAPQPSSGGPALLCENPLPAEIALGTPIESATTQDAPTSCFWIELPAGLESLTVSLSGLSADLELEVGFGFLRTIRFNTGEYWASREAGTAAEAIVLQDPSAGPYFLSVGPAGVGDLSAFRLEVTSTPEMVLTSTGAPFPDGSTCGPPAVAVAMGGSANGEVVARDTSPEPRAYFCVEVPIGVGSLEIAVSELGGDLEVFVTRPGTTDLWLDRSRGGTDRLVVIDAPQPGVYQIEVAGSYPGAESTFTVAVSG